MTRAAAAAIAARTAASTARLYDKELSQKSYLGRLYSSRYTTHRPLPPTAVA